MAEQKTTHLKFFGIGKILPYIKEVRKLMLVMVTFGLLGSLADIVIPQYQRYALDHFIGQHTFDTIVLFVLPKIPRGEHSRAHSPAHLQT